MKVTVNGGTMSQAEIDEYVRRIRKKHPDRIISELTLTINGNYIDIQYNYDTVPFERIRRITGYLVGTLDRFNDAKKAEESHGIKHQISRNLTSGAPSCIFAGYLMITISLWHGSLLFPLRVVLFFGSFDAIPVISPEYMQ